MFKKMSIIALGSALAFSLAACDDSTNKATTNTNDKPKQEEPKKGEKKKITAADVDAIKTGDSSTGEGGYTYEDLVAKFGEPNTKGYSSFISYNNKKVIETNSITFFGTYNYLFTLATLE